MRKLLTQVCETLLIERNDAELIIAALLNKPRYSLYLDEQIDPGDRSMLRIRVAQLKHEIPLEYLTKQARFLDYTLRIEPGVFIPRIETEYFVNLITATIDRPPRVILDIGTGTGAIAIALAHCYPSSRIIATDISNIALQCAQRNITTYELTERIDLVQTNMLDGLDRRFDLIVSNPPYIPSSRLHFLPKSVKCYEPIQALNGGKGGIMFTRKMIERSARYLADNGCIAIEIDDDAVRGLTAYIQSMHNMSCKFTMDQSDRYRYAFIKKVA